jgi:PAS domain S-box-containing protein
MPLGVQGLVPSRILDWDRLIQIAREKRAQYRKAKPFPHIVLDGLFPDSLLDRAVAELPGAAAGWASYNTADERKQVCSDTAAFGPAAETIAHALNSAQFVRFVEELTGVTGLIPDPHLRAAGYMKVPPGGHLGLHYDFTTQKDLKLDRRVNVLLYLNRDWQSNWGGQLELHSNDDLNSPAHRQVTIEPIFNRVAIFDTPNALHGHRRPIACPSGRARLCLSWYYYTAPPVLGWGARERGVSFPGRFDLLRTLTVLANLLLPPILFAAARARVIRARSQRESATDVSRVLSEPDVPLATSASTPAASPGWWQAELLEYTNDTIIVWEMSGSGIVYWNRAAEQLYGYSRHEAQGKSTHELLRTQLSGGVSHLEKSLARYGVWVGELRHRTRDGREVAVEGRLALLSQQNGRWLVLEVNRDISDRRAAGAVRRTMERQLEKLRALRQSVPDT